MKLLIIAVAMSALMSGCVFAQTDPCFPGDSCSEQIVIEPSCLYGYYDFTPYECAPAGYYGSEWFVGGVFIGAGPWRGSYWRTHVRPVVHGPRGGRHVGGRRGR